MYYTRRSEVPSDAQSRTKVQAGGNSTVFGWYSIAFICSPLSLGQGVGGVLYP